MDKDSLKIKIALCWMLFVSCSLWLFDGIIGWKRITFLVFSCGLLILCTKKFKISKPSLIWGLFLLAALMSLLINNSVSSWSLYYFLMYSSIVLYAILINCELPVFKTGIVFLTAIGIFNALAVLLHFFLKDWFNEFYFPALRYQGSLMTASSYYDRGYYFGVNYKPHEAAGLIVFAMAALLIWGMVQTEYKKKWVCIVATCMFIPLMLTGKKGITAFMAAVFMLILLVWYVSQKKWLKIAIAVGGAAVVLIVAVWYIATHLDNPLFYRFASFFENLSSGKPVDAGRGGLRDAAYVLWNENKLFGIGWYQYYDYTVSRFGYNRTHAVNLDYLQFLCETGIFGFVLIMTPILVMLRRTVLVWKKTLTAITEKKTQWIILFAVFVQLFTIIYAFIEVPFYDLMYFTVYIFSCMIINNAYKEKEGIRWSKKFLEKMMVGR